MREPIPAEALARGLHDAFAAYSAGRIDAAREEVDRLIAAANAADAGQRPVLAKLRQLKGVIFDRLEDNQAALAEFSAALNLAPDDQEIRLCVIASCQRLAMDDLQRVEEAARPLLDANDPRIARVAHEATIQALLIGPSPSVEAYRPYVDAWSRRFIQPALAPVQRPRDVGGRALRIGLVHRSFANPFYHGLIGPLFQALRQLGATIAGVSTAPGETEPPPSLRPGIDLWLNIEALSDDAARQEVAALGLDVLVSLDGFSGATRFDLFAARPAPLLVSWHNTHYTFGPGLFDCVIADSTVLSPAERRDYAEAIIDLEPCYFAIEPPVDAPPVAPTPALEAGTVVFGTMNRPSKISSEAAASWRRILDAVPGSWLFLRSGRYQKAGAVEQMSRLLQEAGIAAERCVIAGHAARHEFLESYGLIDIALDTFPFSGGFTTFESLWQGVPVVSFPGERWASRVSASILKACGLDELVAPDRARYEALAIELAADVPRLASLRASIRQRVAASPMTDMPRFAAKFLGALQQQLAARVAAP
jgi:protein O-GlcNAc transferase